MMSFFAIGLLLIGITIDPLRHDRDFPPVDPWLLLGLMLGPDSAVRQTKMSTLSDVVLFTNYRLRSL